MDPAIHQGKRPLGQAYQLFAQREARGACAVYEDWARRVATDAQVLALLEPLPGGKRQPNLVFAAARWHGAQQDYDSFRDTVLGHWPQVRETIMTRATQTNEAGRCATLLPFLAELPQPLALLEVGAAAGLCLLPDHYSYAYDDGTRLDPTGGPSPVLLPCHLGSGVPAPAMPDVAWRAGVDLNPIDATDPDSQAWLETLIWPGQDQRRDRLRAALGIAAHQRPPVLAGDLVQVLPELAAQVPAEATLVVFHSAVLAYLDTPALTAFTQLVSQLPGHWISNEGPSVLSSTAGVDPGDGRFVLAVDGVPRALTGPHGASVVGLHPPASQVRR